MTPISRPRRNAKNKTGPALLASGNSRTARPPPPAASPPPRVPARLPTANVRHLPSQPFRADLVQPNCRGQVSGSRRRIFHCVQHAHAEHYNSTTNNNRFETAALILRGGQDGGGCGGRRGYGAHHIAKPCETKVDLIQVIESWVRMNRSEERRVGKECAGLCRSRWSPYH